VVQQQTPTSGRLPVAESQQQTPSGRLPAADSQQQTPSGRLPVADSQLCALFDDFSIRNMQHCFCSVPGTTVPVTFDGGGIVRPTNPTKQPRDYLNGWYHCPISVKSNQPPCLSSTVYQWRFTMSTLLVRQRYNH